MCVGGNSISFMSAQCCCDCIGLTSARRDYAEHLCDETEKIYWSGRWGREGGGGGREIENYALAAVLLLRCCVSITKQVTSAANERQTQLGTS